ncbi:hypothetical protein [Rhodalgimonas zhirmunskyi]|uniref:Lysozyme inhibitor n=1 Tax=Rhodalgimonas zhirmunskyi TaxID=2964767 RepID=A0AAJ1X2X8_9RHOB|nr:hypothetical protein [Rhodoalgimonas zhirmunskyi]MDQ2092768.1 hypothetical protein [Rhodoalgimonas zhirmunskyi]
MMRLALIPLLATLPLAAQAEEAAFTCRFTAECYEQEACGESTFTLTADLANERIATEFGDLIVVAVKREPGIKTLFATGEGAEYLMSVTPQGARLSSQLNKGPEVLTYFGACEGAFE